MATRPAGVLRHVSFEGLGLIEPILAEFGLPILWLEIGQTICDSDLANICALILMGGPMSANDPEPWVGAEIDLIRRAVRRGVPVLGVCLGAQLVAKALGARVYRNPVKEIGWFETHWTAAARLDPVFGGLPDPAQIFQWHGETFELPENAECLAYTGTCAHQAFRYGLSVYALQFHLEVTPLMIEDWVSEDAKCGDVRELREFIDPRLHAASQAALARMVFRRWVDQIVLP